MIDHAGNHTETSALPKIQLSKDSEPNLIEKAFHSIRTIGITVTDLKGKILYTNPGEAWMHGYQSQELIGMDVSVFSPSEFHSSLKMEEVLEVRSWKRDSMNKRKDGTLFPVELTSEVIVDSSGNPIGIVTICEDLTERKNAEILLAKKTLYDPLTHLANRILFLDRLDLAIRRSKRKGDYNFSVLYLDVDQLRLINHAFGRETGNKVLMEVAQRLKTCLRPADAVARLAEDTFAILLDGVKGSEESVTVVDRIRRVLSTPFHANNRQLFATVSIGIVSDGKRFERADDIVSMADVAVSRAKAHGKARNQFIEEMEIPEPPAADVEYTVTCFRCHESTNMALAKWCDCLTIEQTLICSACNNCFCKAPQSFKEAFWSDAPQLLWDRKVKEHHQNLPWKANPELWQVKRPMVLVVESDSGLQRSATRMISDLGYGAVVARDGQEGLTLAHRYIPELVLTGTLLPKLDGREMCRRIKEDPATSQIKVAVITSLYGKTKFRTEAFRRFRVDQYVVLPLSFSEFCFMLQMFLKQSNT